jgi:diacylglycerol kinase family enzyme
MVKRRSVSHIPETLTEAVVVTEKVVPLLDKLGLHHTAYTTQAPKDAGRIGQEILASHDSSSEPIKVIVAGGDGTAHELIEGVVGLPFKSDNVKTTWQLIILPMGTVGNSHCPRMSSR